MQTHKHTSDWHFYSTKEKNRKSARGGKRTLRLIIIHLVVLLRLGLRWLLIFLLHTFAHHRIYSLVQVIEPNQSSGRILRDFDSKSHEFSAFLWFWFYYSNARSRAHTNRDEKKRERERKKKTMFIQRGQWEWKRRDADWEIDFNGRFRVLWFKSIENICIFIYNVYWSLKIEMVNVCTTHSFEKQQINKIQCNTIKCLWLPGI